MLKRIILVFCGLLFAVCSLVQAVNKQPLVNLYAAPSSANIVKKITLSTKMVPIIYKGGWVKVGLRPSGDVGWINLKQYKKAREDFYKPNIQAVYISTTQDKKGKPTVNVVAYHNGKKLSDKDAKAFYNKMLHQQKKEQHFEKRYWQHFDKMMRRQQHEMDQMFDSDSYMGSDMPIIIMPGPVIMPQKKSANSHKK